MSQLSIAIIKKESITSTEKEPQYEYLIIRELDASKFFDFEEGGSFDFSGFKKQIVQYFELPEKITINNPDLQNSMKKLK